MKRVFKAAVAVTLVFRGFFSYRVDDPAKA